MARRHITVTSTVTILTISKYNYKKLRKGENEKMSNKKIQHCKHNKNNSVCKKAYQERERPKEQEEMGTNELAATTNNNLDDSIWRTKKVTDGGECKIKIKM